MAKKRRSDKANYWALLIVGIGLILLGGFIGPGTIPIGVIALVGAGFYYWKLERATDQGQKPDPASRE